MIATTNRIATFVAAAGLALLVAGPAAADYSKGGAFSAPGYGTRSWGMGGVIGIGNDEGAVYWNPALLAELDRNRLGFSYVNIVPGAEAHQSQLAYAHVLRRGVENEAGLAFNIHTVGALYENLRIELSDGQSYSENSLRLAYAYSPFYLVTIGAGFTVHRSSSDVNGFGSKGTSVDIAGRIALLPGITVALVSRNTLSQIDYEDNTSVTLPRSFTIGAVYTRVSNLAIEGDVEAKFGSFSRFVLGGEYRLYSDLLTIRAGVSSMNAGQSRGVPHLGMGVYYQRVRIDYNADFDSEDAFDTTHRFSLGVGL